MQKNNKKDKEKNVKTKTTKKGNAKVEKKKSDSKKTNKTKTARTKKTKIEKVVIKKDIELKEKVIQDNQFEQVKLETKSSITKKNRIDIFPLILIVIAIAAILILIPLGKVGRDMWKDKQLDKYIQDELVLCGDSYSGYFEIYLKDKHNYDKLSYHFAGHTVSENDSLYTMAMESPHKIIIFTTSINDHFRQTKLEDFREELHKLLQLSKDNNKIVVMHSFMDYSYNQVKNDTGVDPSKYDIKVNDYDKIVKDEASKFDNVIYVNTNDIANFDLLGDGIHYGNRFYNMLYDRIVVALKEYLKNNHII